MKYEQKVVERQTEHGKVWETVSVPALSRRERRAEKRQQAGNKKKGLLEHPIVLVFIGILAIIITFLLSSSKVVSTTLIEQYVSLTARRSDSKAGFDKKLFYITTNADGTKSVTVGFRSEVEQEIVQQALSEAGVSSNIVAGLKQDPMSFYDKCTLSKGNKLTKSIGDVYLYDGLPWDNNDNTYILKIEECENYINQFLNAQRHTAFVTDDACSSTAIFIDDNGNIVTEDNDNDGVKDGVACMDFAAYPILAFCEIDEYGNPIGWGETTRPRKVCAVLSDASETLYYLPLTCVGDAKGHSWPGGVMQTFLSHSGSADGWKFNNDGGPVTGDIIGKTITTLSDIAAGYATIKYNGALVTTTSPSLNLEINPSYVSKIGSIYKLVGFISWKE